MPMSSVSAYNRPIYSSATKTLARQTRFGQSEQPKPKQQKESSEDKASEPIGWSLVGSALFLGVGQLLGQTSTATRLSLGFGGAAFGYLFKNHVESQEQNKKNAAKSPKK